MAVHANRADVPVVLIVDDEPANLAVFARTFRHDFTVLTAASPEEALRVLGLERVDVVFSDFTMPEMTGTEFLEIVAERWPDAARVILSGYSDIDEIRCARETRVATAALVKPWDRANVLALVADVLRSRAAPDATAA